ncbi:hypothetical protein KHP62_04525 [Rhodobacteraceae bacterium NNCM2]|nr:hypothetical protein [Coraliihabitans acroporae]
MSAKTEGADRALDAALIAAHDAGDHLKLVTLYTEAAEAAEKAGDIDACCFYLTHAYVFALETGHDEADNLKDRLKAYEREE